MNRSHITIDTTFNIRSHGYLLAEGEIGLVMRRFEDFWDDGYAFFPRASVGSIESDASSTRAFFERAYREEGLYDSIDFEKHFQLSSYEEFFWSLMGTDVMISLTDERILYGRIFGVSDASIGIRSFKSDGTWSHRYEFNFINIRDLLWDNKYLQVFSRHLPND